MTLPDDPAPDGSPADAATDAQDVADAKPDDAGDAGGPDAASLDPFDRHIVLPGAGYATLKSFAQQPDGTTWLMTYGSSTYEVSTVLIAGHDDTANASALDSPPVSGNDGTFQLAGDSVAYLLSRTAASSPTVLVPPSRQLRPVTIGATCAIPIGAGYFTVGRLSGQTVAVYGNTFGNASVGIGQGPGCFLSTVLDSSSGISAVGRGREYFGKFRVPVNSDAGAIMISADVSGAGLQDPFAFTYGGSQVMQQSFVGTGDDGFVVGTTSASTAVFFHVSGAVPTPDAAALRADPARIATEVFGAGGKACARLEDGNLFREIGCVRPKVGGFEQFNLATSDDYADLHLYGDASYLYVAKACAPQFEPIDSVRVRALPWDQVDESSLAGFSDTCADFDGGD